MVVFSALRSIDNNGTVVAFNSYSDVLHIATKGIVNGADIHSWMN